MIRRAEPEDRPQIMLLIQEFFEEELNGRGYSFSYDQCEQDYDVLEKRDDVITLVIDNDGMLDGMICAFVTRRVFFQEVTATELIWYVRKTVRRDGIKLLREFENFCSQAQCNDITMIGLVDSKAEDMYPRMGYERSEMVFVKKIKKES